MELTNRELEIAERCISKRERQLAQWPLRRWLLVAIFSLFALLGYRGVNDGMRSIGDDKATDLAVSRALGEDPPPGQEQRWAVGTIMKIGKIHDLRYEVVTCSLMQAAVGYLTLISGVIMVCLTLLRWKTSERDALICKLLRAKLQELQQNAAPSRHPPLPSTAALEVQLSEIKKL